MTQQKNNAESKSCYQCEGKGYTEIRDCAGEIQRTESCSYCEGKGYTDSRQEVKQLRAKS